MNTEARQEAERAWANLAGQESSLLFLDQYAGIERIALLAGFAARGLTGYGQLQRVVGQLLCDGSEAIPAKRMVQLEARTERMLAALRHGDEGRVFVDKEADGSTANEWWPFFFRSAQSRLCEVLVPALVAGHANAAAELEPRSACLRAACGVLWTIEQVHYGPAQAPLLARTMIEALELPPADEHRGLVEGVLASCDEAQLLDLLLPPQGEAGPWRFSSDYRICRWGPARFSFTDTQSRIVRALHEEYERTGCGLGADALCREAGLERNRAEGVSVGSAIRNAFRKKSCMHPCWDAMVRKSGRDVFELVPPPTD